MSRQTNFYAHPLDTVQLHSWLLNQFSGLTVIRTVVGRSDELEPVPASEALEGQERMFLVPVWGRGRLVREPYTEGWRAQAGQSLLRTRVSPVIEYCPPGWEETSRTARIGRLYWRYEGELTPEERRQLDRMFRWLRTQTVPLPPAKSFRIFPEAAVRAQILADWGSERPNPLFEGETPRT